MKYIQWLTTLQLHGTLCDMSMEQTRRTAVRPNVAPRRIVLVDVENAVGGSSALRDHALWAKRAIEDAVAPRPGDQVIIGVGPAGLLDLACVWTHVRYVVRAGVDGADLALLEVFEEDIAERFAEVVLVSGDGIFANAVAALGSRGVRTTVLAHADGLSRRLELAANELVLLADRPSPRATPAASHTDVA